MQAVSILLLWPVLAQTPAPQPATIRSGATEVLVDVVVRDKRGRPVRDLTPADVTISSDGKTYSPTSLRYISGGLATPSTASTAPAQPASAQDALKESRFVTLLFEPLPRESARLASDTAITLIEKASGPKVFFSVLLAREKLRLVEPFTNDQERLKKAIRAVTLMAGSRETDDLATQAERIIRDLSSSEQELYQIRTGSLPTSRGPSNPASTPVDGADMSRQKQIELTLNTLAMADSFQRQYSGRVSLNALRAAIKAVSGLPGRKTIVYVCRGLGSHPSLSPVFQNLIESANAAGVSIYGIDATGLEQAERTREAATMLARAAAASAATLANDGSKAVTRDEVMAFETAEQSAMANPSTLLAELAASTGGLILADSNDSRKMATQIAEDIGSYWELSYSPELAELDGAFHPLSVKVKRPNLKVQARKGFYALPPGASAGVAPFEIPLLSALNANPAPNAIPFTATAIDLASAPPRIRGEVLLEIPIREFDLEELPNENLFHLRAGVLALLRDSTGNIAERISQQIDYRGPLSKLEASRQGTLQWHRTFSVPPGRYTLEVALSDRQSRRLGTQRLPLELIARQPNTLALSAISRVRVDPAPPNTTPSLWDFNGATLTPFVTAKVPLAGAKSSIPLHLVVEPADSPAPITLTAGIHRDGELIAQLAVPFDAKPTANNPLPYVMSLPTESLEPGAYEIRFEAKQAAQSSTRSYRFDLLPSPDYKPKPIVSQAKPQPTPTEAVETAATLKVEAFREIAPTSALSPSGQKDLLDRIRQRGRDWASHLTNFLCLQITDRLFDRNGSGKWARGDSLREMVTYYNGKESYDVLYEGTSFAADRPSSKGIRSFGEFGGLMQIVLGKKVDSTLEWKGLVERDGRTMHRITYKVPQSRSGYTLTKQNPFQSFSPSYEGELFAETDSLNIRRITLRTGEIPDRFPFQEATHEVDYDFQLIGGSPHLLPIKAVMQTRVGKRRLARSEMTFSNYRKWSSDAKVTFDSEPAK